MKIIGLTGGIGSGKSTVSGYLRRNGFTIIDADQIAHEIVEPGSSVLRQLISAFGRDILAEDGTLDRKKLAERAFASHEGKSRLDDITHREIQERMRQAIEAYEGELLFLDVPLLFESGMDTMADETWVVDVEDEERIRRVILRDNICEETVRARIDKQMPRQEKLKRADHILQNSGTLDELYIQIDQLMGDHK